MKTDCTTDNHRAGAPPRRYQNIPATSEAHRIIKAEAAHRGLLLKDFMTEIATGILTKNGAKQ